MIQGCMIDNAGHQRRQQLGYPINTPSECSVWCGVWWMPPKLASVCYPTPGYKIDHV